MNKILQRLIKSSFLMLSFTLLLGKSPGVCQDFKEDSEAKLYQQGLEYQNAGEIQEALECFLPLAEKGYGKAQHNAGMQYYRLGNEKQAYQWLKQASEQGSTLSYDNLKKMNLLLLLLPDEILNHIATYLSIPDLVALSQVSRKWRSVCQEELDKRVPYINKISQIQNKLLNAINKEDSFKAFSLLDSAIDLVKKIDTNYFKIFLQQADAVTRGESLSLSGNDLKQTTLEQWGQLLLSLRQFDGEEVDKVILSGPAYIKVRNFTLQNDLDALGGAVIVAEKFNFMSGNIWNPQNCHLIKVSKVKLDDSLQISE